MRFLTFMLCSVLSALGLSGGAHAESADVYAYRFKGLEAAPVDLEQYRGKVVLIVNTASRCGFTKQYAGLEKLYETYRERGLVVLGVPSNDFAQQEPGTASQIKQFCETNYHITFPMTEKVEVTGANAHPFFKQVRKELGTLASPHWNFYKYLVGRDGHIVAWFSSFTAPDASSLVKAVEAELAKSGKTQL